MLQFCAIKSVKYLEFCSQSLDFVPQNHAFISASACHLPNTPALSINEDRNSNPYFNLIFSRSSLREIENDTTASQTFVDFAVGIKSVINTTSLLLIQHNLQSLAAIFLSTDTLANNLDWVNEITEDRIMNSGESSGTRTLLSLRSTGSVASFWAGKNAASCEDYDVTIRELLLELTSETLLNSVEAWKGWDGDKDDNRLLAVANFNLSCVDELKRAKGGLQISSVGFEVIESAGNAGLKL